MQGITRLRQTRSSIAAVGVLATLAAHKMRSNVPNESAWWPWCVESSDKYCSTRHVHDNDDDAADAHDDARTSDDAGQKTWKVRNQPGPPRSVVATV